jgi:hypothetical protein
MTRALGLSAFVLMLATPFVDYVYFQAMAALFVVAFVCWVLSEIIRPKPEPTPEIDEAQLQHELEGLIRQMNAEDGK